MMYLKCDLLFLRYTFACNSLLLRSYEWAKNRICYGFVREEDVNYKYREFKHRKGRNHRINVSSFPRFIR